LERLGYHLVREGNHIAMVRQNPDGTRTPLTIPNHRTIKSSTPLSAHLGFDFFEFPRGRAVELSGTAATGTAARVKVGWFSFGSMPLVIVRRV
jgi:hypothetical protein